MADQVIPTSETTSKTQVVADIVAGSDITSTVTDSTTVISSDVKKVSVVADVKTSADINGTTSDATVLTVSNVTSGGKGEKGDPGIQGLTGPQGAKGDKGDTVVSVQVGTTTTGSPGGSASVANSGTPTEAVLNFTIPTGYGVIPGGTAGQLLSKVDGTDYNTEWVTKPPADVVGPAAASIDNRVTRFDGNTGKLIQASSVTIDDNGAIYGPQAIEMSSGSTFPIDWADMVWNETTNTWQFGMGINDLVVHDLGMEQFLRVVNKTGSTLSKANYQVVYADGAQGQRPKVALSKADADPTSARTLGLVRETIYNNGEGLIITSGLLPGVNTTGSLQGETWSDGDVLWLSPTTAGAVTNVKPSAPNHTVLVGYVVHAHNTQGKIFVHIQNGYELDEIHDVAITSPSNGQALTYDSTAKLWKNTTLAPGGVTSVSKSGSTKLTGDVTLSAGSNVSLTQAGQDIQIAVSGGGDVVGPASSVNNNVAFFNGTTGKLIKDSGLTLSGTNTGDQTVSAGNNTQVTVVGSDTKVDAKVAISATAPTSPIGGAFWYDTSATTTVVGILQAVYPVGSIYTSTVSTSPATLFGFGTWSAFGEGRVLVGKATSGTFATAGATGGSETHTLTEAELPSITGSLNMHGQENGTHIYTATGKFTSSTTITNKYQAGHAATTGANSLGPVTFSFGSGQAHNNLQPYIVVYMWKRDA